MLSVGMLFSFDKKILQNENTNENPQKWCVSYFPPHLRVRNICLEH